MLLVSALEGVFVRRRELGGVDGVVGVLVDACCFVEEKEEESECAFQVCFDRGLCSDHGVRLMLRLAAVFRGAVCGVVRRRGIGRGG